MARKARWWRFPCRDCGWETLPGEGQPGEWYMLHDEVWQAAWGSGWPANDLSRTSCASDGWNSG